MIENIIFVLFTIKKYFSPNFYYIFFETLSYISLECEWNEMKILNFSEECALAENTEARRVICRI